MANYLRVHTANRWARLGLTVGMVMTLLSVVGSHSRGAYLSLGALLVLWWFRSRNKFTFLLLTAAVAAPTLYFMPLSFYDRLSTLQAMNEDVDFLARVEAWQVSLYYALDHFPLGAGFAGPELAAVYTAYFPDQVSGSSHAAHSIYFQVLGEHGFIALAIYLLIIFLAFQNCYRIRKAASNRPDLAWARDLAGMLQLSLMIFCIGGAALSLAYYDMFIIWVGLLPALRHLVTHVQVREATRPHMSPPAFGSYGTRQPSQPLS